ncbi:MAG: DUF1800 domain-containing protein [Chitinophagaceae bacterium]
MNGSYRVTAIIVVFCVATTSWLKKPEPENSPFKFPYSKGGLTQGQAAAHLLSRFTFGAKPGDVEKVLTIGMEKWFQQQLDANLPDDTLKQKLAGYDAINLTNEQAVETFPRGGQILRLAVKDGAINKDSVNKGDGKAYKQQLAAYMQTKGIKPQQELYRQLINQKILRAVYSNNQLQEVLTDFWFNHFNVSIVKNDCATFIPAYERDVIRPNVLAHFNELLIATAKSPAMLMYLDNFSSAAPDNAAEDPRKKRRLATLANETQTSKLDTGMKMQAMQKLVNAKKNQGINENYAREVMELHTLGVDGGYTQQDVTQAARVLTGWTLYPMGDYGYASILKRLTERMGEEKMKQQGFVHDGDFLFAANRHDKNEKKVLGKTFPANGGYEEGVELLNMLAHQKATANFITKKLAIRFVSDNPPQSLLDKMAHTFLMKDGSIKEVLITMVSAPEFWSGDAVRAKTKSPFELAVSSVRSLDAEVNAPFQLFNWITRMGQRIYYYQAPTGFPDRGQYWINTGALLNRMNFGLALASQKIPGITINLLALNKNHEPESAEAALAIYGKVLMPERDLAQTIARLTPLLNDPELIKKVDAAATKSAPPEIAKPAMADDNMMMNGKFAKEKPGKKAGAPKNSTAMQSLPGNVNMLSQVAGIIIGSPEYQRR